MPGRIRADWSPSNEMQGSGLPRIAQPTHAASKSRHGNSISAPKFWFWAERENLDQSPREREIWAKLAVTQPESHTLAFFPIPSHRHHLLSDPLSAAYVARRFRRVLTPENTAGGAARLASLRCALTSDHQRRDSRRSRTARRCPCRRRAASASPMRTRTGRSWPCSTSAARSASAGQFSATGIQRRRSGGADVRSLGRARRHSHGLRRQTIGALAGGSGVRALLSFSRRDLQVQNVEPILLFDLLLFLLLSVTAR